MATATGAVSAAWRSRKVPARHPPIGRFVGPPGARLHFLQRGTGQDVVLLHGAGVNLHDMAAGPLDALAQRFRVTVFDRPGHGHSDADLENASPSAQAEKIHAAVDELGLDRPVIIGHSLGGSVALAYGAAFPGETTGVVLLAPLCNPIWGAGHVGPALHVVPGAGLMLSRSLFALWDPLLMRVALRAIFAPQQPTARFQQEFPSDMSGLPLAMRADGADFLSATVELRRMRRSYSTYPVPVQIVVGAEDRVLKPARHAERLARYLPDARLRSLPGLGHMLHHFAADVIVEVTDDLLTAASQPRAIKVLASVGMS